MSRDITNHILNKLSELHFDIYELDNENFKLILSHQETCHEKVFTQIQHVTECLMDLNVKFLIDSDGSIIIK